MSSATNPQPVNSPCCGNNFTFSIENIEEISNLFFYYAGNNTIMATYSKDGKLYLAISYNCGTTFEPPEEILEINGNITNLQVLSKGHQFVIGAQVRDAETGMEIKKAVSGWINYKKMTASFKSDDYTISKNEKFAYKSCTDDRPRKLINVSLAFVKIPSQDSKALDEEPSINEQSSDEGTNEASIDYVFDRNGSQVFIECRIHCGLLQ